MLVGFVQSSLESNLYYGETIWLLHVEITLIEHFTSSYIVKFLQSKIRGDIEDKKRFPFPCFVYFFELQSFNWFKYEKCLFTAIQGLEVVCSGGIVVL